MTWGEMRALLKQQSPDASLERLSAALNEAFEDILGRQPWRRLRGSQTVQTVAKYITGTVAANNGSQTVTGTGTAWTSAMTGRKIRIGSDTQFYTLTYVSATELSLDREYEGTTATGLAYRIFQNVVTLGEDVAAVREVNYPNLRQLGDATVSEFDGRDPARATYGDPLFWAPHYRTDPNNPPSVEAIELWPSPEEVKPLVIQYRRVITGFDGTNTSDTPPAWVSAGAIRGLAEFELFKDETALAHAERLILGMVQNEIEGQPKGVVIPRDERYAARRLNTALRRNPGADAWARSD